MLLRIPVQVHAAAAYLLAVVMGLVLWNRPEAASGSPLQAEFWTTLIIGLILSATLVALQELLRPKQDIENAKPAGEGEFKFPTATEGRPVPLIWGKVKLAGPNVIWWGDFRQVPVRESIKTGLWSKQRITTGFRYFVGMDLAFCRGGAAPVTLHQLYIGDKPVTLTAGLINEPNLLGGEKFGSGGIVGQTEFFPGTETQIRSTYLRQFQDPMSAQRGTAHLVAEGIWIGNTTQIKPWAAECSRFPSGLLDTATAAGENGDYSSGENIILSDDLNPMEVAYEAITDDDWGMARLSSKVDLASFSAAASTLHTEGNGFGMQLERISIAQDVLDLVQEQISGVIYLDRKTGKYKVRLAREDYVTSATVSSVTGANTYNVAEDGTTFVNGEPLFAEGHDDPKNNGRKTVVSSTATTVTVSETLVNETPTGVAFISSLNGIDKTNRITLKEFSRQTWDGLTNQIRIEFADRARDYFVTFARSDNLANQNLQKGQIVIANSKLPGIKRAQLATDIAARNILFLSFPLSKATIIVNREFWDLNPGDVLRLTDENLGLVNLVMRVTRIDFGNFETGDITLIVVQDIFSLKAGFFGAPPIPLWTLPVQDVAPIPINEHQVFEAPRKFVTLDILHPERKDRVFVSARAQSGETAIKIFQRNDTVTPTGAFGLDGTNEGLFLIGSLNVALLAGNANPTPTLQINSSPDAKVRIELDFDPDGATATEIGQDLANLIKIGDEFIGVEGLTDAGGNLLNFTNAYRGLLDSVPADHDVGAFVYLLYVSGGLNDAQIPPANLIDVQPRTVSRDDELTEGDSKTFSFTMGNRYRLPYPPSAIEVDTVRFPATPSLDGTITNPGGDTDGIDLEWLRRDWENTDEVVALSDDAGVLDAGFQAKHDHESLLNSFVIDSDALRIQVGVPNLTFINGNTGVDSRSDIISMTDGAPPTGYIPSIQVRHTFETVTYLALALSEYECAPASSFLAALTNLGTVFANGPISRVYTITSAVTHDLTLGTSITGVEYQLNSDPFEALVNLSSETLAVSDTLRFRHTDTSQSPMNTTAILDENGTDRAYVVFNTSTEFDALVAYYTMNELSTGVSQVNRAARFGGAPDFVDQNDTSSSTAKSTPFVNALRPINVASTIEHLSLSNTAAADILLPNADWTIMGWFRVAELTTDQQCILAQFDVASGSPFTGRSFFLGFDSGGSGRAEAIVYSDATPFFRSHVSGASSVLIDTWFHLAATFDQSTGLLVLYLDGTAQSGAPAAIAGNFRDGSTVTTNLTSGAVMNGGSADTASTSTSGMDVDDVRVYHRLLSGGEISSIASATQPLE